MNSLYGVLTANHHKSIQCVLVERRVEVSDMVSKGNITSSNITVYFVTKMVSQNGAKC